MRLSEISVEKKLIRSVNIGLFNKGEHEAFLTILICMYDFQYEPLLFRG